MKKHILVTGGTGYIGSHMVVRLIEAGMEPIIFDNFYHTQTEALVGFYQSLVAKGDSKTKYIKIDGVGDVNEVSRRIFDALDR